MADLLKARSLLDLRSMLGLSPQEILTVTHISGKINAQSYRGSGVGSMDPVLGRSTSEIELVNFPSSFAVPMCQSWKCKKHVKPKADAYRQEATIEYSKGAAGTIFTVGEVRRLGIGVSLCFNTFDGEYTGPTCVEKVLPWRVTYKRTGVGTYDMTCLRQIIAEGHLVEAHWHGKMIIADGEDLPDHTIDFVQEDFSWVWDPNKSCYTETLRFRFSH